MIKAYAEYIIIWALRSILNIFNVCPIKENRIMFYSFNGKQYSCNPKYISEQLMNDGDIEIYWAFRHPEKFISDLPERIKTVRYRSLRYYFLTKTSKVLVLNVQGYGELARRKGQIFIQTWHASNGYKKVGNLTGIAKKVNLLGHKDYSYVTSGTDSMIQRRVRGSMGFKGEVIPGTPRMDVIIRQRHPELRDKVYGHFGIAAGKRILLYAPTWRKNRYDNDYGLEYGLIKQAMEDRFGGDWMIAVRLHPNVYVEPDINFPFVVNATCYPDMQELLYVADALISDYSSCIWDYSFTKRPCFLYCTDLDKYGKDRDFDIPVSRWGFPIATDMKEMISAILDFDENHFISNIGEHHKEMGNLEDGHATERVCRLIRNCIGKHKDEAV